MADHQTPSPRPAGSRDLPASYRQALAAAQAGRFDEAIAALRRILAATPDHIDARVLLGTSLAAIGRPGQAEGMLRSATALDPVNIPARLRLGDLLAELGRRTEALSEYRAVLTIDPDHPTARAKVIELSDPKGPAPGSWS